MGKKGYNKRKLISSTILTKIALKPCDSKLLAEPSLTLEVLVSWEKLSHGSVSKYVH